MKLSALKFYSLNFMNFKAFCSGWKEYCSIKIGILWVSSFLQHFRKGQDTELHIAAEPHVQTREVIIIFWIQLNKEGLKDQSWSVKS